MRNIKYIVLLFLFLSVPSSLLAQETDKSSSMLAVTNGSSIDGGDGEYKNSIVINGGIAIHEKNLDYRLDTGLLSSIMMSNPNIVFNNFVPSSTETITDVESVNIGVTVHTVSGKIRQVGYRVSQTMPTSKIGPFTMIYTTATAGSGTLDEVTVSTAAVNLFKQGINYIQWFAQNTVEYEDGDTATWVVQIGELAGYIDIMQPSNISSSKPQIQAKIYSPNGFSGSSVTVKMCSGTSTATVINTETVVGKFVDDKNLYIDLDYKYSGNPLEAGREYTVWIIIDDSSGETLSYAATFTVIAEAISELLPYPSPYDPKKGLLNIKFVISNPASVTINIYDRAGKFVSNVLDSVSKPSGENKVTWNAKSYAGDNLANGVYICEIITKSGGKENRRYKSFAILRK
ncbi:MAG: hypothetical protein FWH43_03605 [Endomicrobia bacterium]|nr:hypothetical protein [Endomicrobiia bacterium]